MTVRQASLHLIAIFSALLCLPVPNGHAHPPPFSVHDLDQDGYVSRQEFEAFRAKRHAERVAEGRRLRNAPRMLEFEDIDTDDNGQIDEMEMLEAIERRPTPEQQRSWRWPTPRYD